MAPLGRALAVCAAAASCGRIEFAVHHDAGATDANATDGADSTVDAGPDAATGPALAAFAAQVGSGAGTAVPAAIPSGDLLVVAITTWDGTDVASVFDAGGSALTSAGVRANINSTSSELWYASPSEATDTISVAMTAASAGYDVWVAAFSGVAIGAPAAAAHGCLTYPPALVSEPVATIAPGELVVNATMFAEPVFIAAVDPPFSAIGSYLSGNGAVYYVTPGSGSYGPSWTIGSGAGMTATTCASTVAFLPAP